jgi:hypothetical protein
MVDRRNDSTDLLDKEWFCILVWIFLPILWAMAFPINVFTYFRDQAWLDGVGFWQHVLEYRS